ncbi:MAG: zf-HC2 domain-containing protein [Acidobacteria bacterium]|nr:zf-HC2 domain-containing protein [Acidobacteriota bacterium]
MNCQEVVRWLTDYLDGELDATLLETLEAHLRDCDDCRIVVDTTRKTIELYCRCEPLPLPPGVRERLDAALARRLSQRGA